MLTAEVFQLFQVKLCGAFADPVQIEPFLRLCVGKEFVIPMAPAQTGEVVAHARRGIAHHLIFLRAKAPWRFDSFLPSAP